jgi:hypothetical protein
MTYRLAAYDYTLRLDVNGRTISGRRVVATDPVITILDVGPSASDAGDRSGKRAEAQIDGLPCRFKLAWVKLQSVYGGDHEDLWVRRDGRFILPFREGRYLALVFVDGELLTTTPITLPAHGPIWLTIPVGVKSR